MLTFIHSGKLWHDALVLMDEGTESLWSQATGEAILGPLADARLDRVPSILTTWEEWLADHPDTLVLPSEHSRRKLRMRLYPKTNTVLGILGSKNPDRRLPGKTTIVGFVGEDGGCFAVALSSQAVPQRATVRVDETPMIVEHEGGQGPTRVWESTGPLDWGKIEQRPATVMYWFVWSALHPGCEIIRAEIMQPE